MGVLVAIILVCWLISKAVHEAKLDHAYAKQGLTSPRLQAKYGTKEKAQAKVAKYGFVDHLRDAWRDYWPRRTDAVIAARDARHADGSRIRLRDRLQLGRSVIDAPARPVPDPKVSPAAAEVSDVPAPTVPTETTEPKAPTTPTSPADGLAIEVPPVPASAPAAPATDPAQSEPNGGPTTMSAPTGEVVNYESALAEIDAQIDEVRQRIDSDKAALDALGQAKAAVDAMQQNYQASAMAAQNKLDHETALNLDGTTLGHAGTTVDAMPVNAVDGLYDQMEVIEELTSQRLQSDEIALASLEAERAHLVATYGDAHAIVSGNLGGDSRFLDSAGVATVRGGIAYAPPSTPGPATGNYGNEPAATTNSNQEPAAAAVAA